MRMEDDTKKHIDRSIKEEFGLRKIRTKNRPFI